MSSINADITPKHAEAYCSHFIHDISSSLSFEGSEKDHAFGLFAGLKELSKKHLYYIVELQYLLHYDKL